MVLAARPPSIIPTRVAAAREESRVFAIFLMGQPSPTAPRHPANSLPLLQGFFERQPASRSLAEGRARTRMTNNQRVAFSLVERLWPGNHANQLLTNRCGAT
jgi:hypothetical protein